MTENEAIKQFEERIEYWGGNEGEVQDYIEAMKVAVSALEEIQQYHVIGTVEELQRAVKKQNPKKVEIKKENAELVGAYSNK